jgi:hypothetical protein
MPRQTKDTALPNPPAPPIDWAKIAQSGRVWEFIEGEDFTGKASSYRARAKTTARKLGIDFNSTEVQRGGKTVLKILAFTIEPNRPHDTTTPAPPAGSTGAVPSRANPPEELRLIP